MTLAAPAVANAQLTFQSPPSQTGPGIDLTDLAYDEINNVYFQVYLANARVMGRFMDTNGKVLGNQFLVSTSVATFAGWPQVAYSTGSDAGVFFVTYASDVMRADRAKNVYGQIVRFNPSTGNGDLVGGAFPLCDQSRNAANGQEPGGISFDPFTKQFLATWTDARFGGANNDAFGRLFNTSGAPAGAEVNISATALWQGAPNAAFDWNTRRFMVVWKGESANSSAVLGSWGRILDENAQPITPVLTLSIGGFQDVEDIVYLPEAQQFFAFWREEQAGTGTNVIGRLISPAGAMGSIFPVVATGGWDGVPDGDYNWSSRTAMVVAQHSSGYVWATQLNGVGQPIGGAFQASHVAPLSGNSGGSTWPQVIAGANGQFGIGFSANFNSSWIERWKDTVAATPGPHPGGGGGQPETPVTIDLSPTAAPNGSWFFAEGASSASAGFKTYYLLANENETPVTVRAYFSDEGGHTKTKDFTVAAHSRSTPELAAIAGDGAYGTVFQSITPNADIYVERSIYWGPAWEGSTSEVATKMLGNNWYFAEGSRGGEVFSNFFLLFNPTQTASTVSLVFYRDALPNVDSTPVTVNTIVPAQTRVTVDANSIPALAGRNFSLVVQSSAPIVAERAMYWGPNWLGGTASLGSQTYSQSWYFAEGAAANGFESFYLLFNPNDFDITVVARLLPGQDSTLGTAKHVPITVKAKSRATFYLNAELGNVGGVGSHFFSNDGAFLAERSVYWGNYQGYKLEGTNVVGSPVVAREWHLPEGTTGGQFTTYLLLANPTQFGANINVTLFIEAASPLRVTLNTPLHIGPYERLSINMADIIKQLGAQEGTSFMGLSFSTRLSVQAAPDPGQQGLIVAEHSIFWNPAGPGQYWHAGGGSMGIAR